MTRSLFLWQTKDRPPPDVIDAVASLDKPLNTPRQLNKEVCHEKNPATEGTIISLNLPPD